MKLSVRPELPTAALRSSQATLAAVDISAPLATRPESTYKSGKVVQTNGATSPRCAELVLCIGNHGFGEADDRALRSTLQARSVNPETEVWTVVCRKGSNKWRRTRACARRLRSGLSNDLAHMIERGLCKVNF
jgi:hypothetical protein